MSSNKSVCRFCDQKIIIPVLMFIAVSASVLLCIGAIWKMKLIYPNVNFNQANGSEKICYFFSLVIPIYLVMLALLAACLNIPVVQVVCFSCFRFGRPFVGRGIFLMFLGVLVLSVCGVTDAFTNNGMGAYTTVSSIITSAGFMYLGGGLLFLISGLFWAETAGDGGAAEVAKVQKSENLALQQKDSEIAHLRQVVTDLDRKNSQLLVDAAGKEAAERRAREAEEKLDKYDTEKFGGPPVLAPQGSKITPKSVEGATPGPESDIDWKKKARALESLLKSKEEEVQAARSIVERQAIEIRDLQIQTSQGVSRNTHGSGNMEDIPLNTYMRSRDIESGPR